MRASSSLGSYRPAKWLLKNTGAGGSGIYICLSQQQSYSPTSVNRTKRCFTILRNTPWVSQINILLNSPQFRKGIGLQLTFSIRATSALLLQVVPQPPSMARTPYGYRVCFLSTTLTLRTRAGYCTPLQGCSNGSTRPPDAAIARLRSRREEGCEMVYAFSQRT